LGRIEIRELVLSSYEGFSGEGEKESIRWFVRVRPGVLLGHMEDFHSAASQWPSRDGGESRARIYLPE